MKWYWKGFDFKCTASHDSILYEIWWQSLLHSLGQDTLSDPQTNWGADEEHSLLTRDFHGSNPLIGFLDISDCFIITLSSQDLRNYLTDKMHAPKARQTEEANKQVDVMQCLHQGGKTKFRTHGSLVRNRTKIPFDHFQFCHRNHQAWPKPDKFPLFIP